MGHKRHWVAAPAAAGVIALVVGVPAQADISASAEAGVGYSDNITRVADNEIDETIGTVGLDLAWRERTRRIRGNALVDLSYFEYVDNTYDSEIVGTANGTLSVAVIPERFNWIFQDSFGQAQSDPFLPSTPETREDLNYFTTGPDLTMRFGSTGFGRLFGRWSSTNYEDSPLDAERTAAGASVGRRASPRSELSLNAVTESTDFDNEFNTDYDRESAFIGWRLDASRTTLNTELGYTWLKRDGAEETGSALVNINVTRELTASSDLNLSLSQQFGDGSDSLRSQLDGNVVGSGGSQITATSDPFLGRTISLEWNYLRNRTGFGLGASHSNEEYETATALDRKRDVFSARFNRQLASVLSLEFTATLESEKFSNVAQENDELRFAATLNWRAWRRLGLRLLVERADRDTEGGTGIGDFVENRAFLTFAYNWGAQDISEIGRQ